MSAFQCTLTHLTAIVGTYIGTRSYRQYEFENYAGYGFGSEGELLVSILDKANVRSLDARYHLHKHYTLSPDSATADKLLNYFECNPLTPGEMFKAINCLEYQSCEFDGWYESDAYKLLRIIRNSTQERVQGYEDAPWGMEDLDPRLLESGPILLSRLAKG
tara:strand:+ start:1791 stop:2273 length:483 start_codon:yes stop_codon:yes gene_type:complete